MQVSETLSDEARESQSVGQLKQQLQSLQTEVDAASQRLAMTKARVQHNMQRVDQLKAEAVSSIRDRRPHTGPVYGDILHGAHMRLGRVH